MFGLGLGVSASRGRGRGAIGRNMVSISTYIQLNIPMDGQGEKTYPLNQITALGAHKRRDGHVGPSDPPLRHDGGILEGGLANEELVREDAEAPQVDLLVVRVVGGAGLDHLRGQVVEGAAHGLAAAVGGVHAPPEVGQLDLAVDADEDVLGLDVPVDDVLAVQVAQRARHLRDVLRGLPLGEAVLAAQVLVELALAGELDDQEHALAVVEVAVQLQDVGVPQVALDLDLAAHLALDPAVLQLVLVQHLQRADEPVRPLPRQVHPPELALAQRPPDLEHPQVELLRYRGLLHERRGRLPLDVDYLVGGSGCCCC